MTFGFINHYSLHNLCPASTVCATCIFEYAPNLYSTEKSRADIAQVHIRKVAQNDNIDPMQKNDNQIRLYKSFEHLESISALELSRYFVGMQFFQSSV